MPMEQTIFVVDDDAAVRDSLHALLESAGLTVQTYDSGQEFLEASIPPGRGCVLVDLDLSDMSGLEILPVLAAKRPDISVIVMTGRAGAAAKARILQADAVTLLENPLREQLLLDTIRQALERHA